MNINGLTIICDVIVLTLGAVNCILGFVDGNLSGGCGWLVAILGYSRLLFQDIGGE